MKKLVSWIAASAMAIGTVAFAPTVATADYFDNFDSYALGNINGQGPWVYFGGALPSLVSNAQAFSGTQSLALSTVAATGGYGSDTYIANWNGAPVTSGIWSGTLQLYIPAAFNGQLHMFFSQGAMPTTFDEGAWVRVNNNAGAGNINRFNFVNGPTPAPLVYDQWAGLGIVINLDANTLDLAYNNAPFYSGAWDVQFPGGFIGLGGINFWVDGGSAPGGTVYIDNFNLTQIPEPTSLGLSGLALLGLAGFRRKR